MAASSRSPILYFSFCRSGNAACWQERFPVPVPCACPPAGLLQPRGSAGTNPALHRMLFWEAGRALRITPPNAWSSLLFLTKRPGRVGVKDAQDVPHPTPVVGKDERPHSRASAFPLEKGAVSSTAKLAEELGNASIAAASSAAG